MTQKLTEPGTIDGAQGDWVLPAAYWMTSERYSKKILTNPNKNHRGDWGHELIGGGREGIIRIVFQNMGVMVNTSDQLIHHKLDTLKSTMINEGIELIGILEENSNWSKFP